MTNERERTFRWSDPQAVTQAFLGRAGIDALNAMRAGEIPHPPIAVAFGMQLTHVERGLVRFTIEPQPWMNNPMGSVHGGILATVLDTALTCCVFAELPAGLGCTTTDLQVRFLRPLRGDGPRIVAEARAIHVGRSLAAAEATATDENGKLYAHATTGLAVIDVAKFAPR